MKSMLSFAAGAAIACGAAVAAEQTLQLPEDSAVSGNLSGSPTRVCRTGARWMRLGFESLVLEGNDSLELTSSQNIREVLRGNRWQDRSFYTRALRGSCVSITTHFSNPGSRYALSGYQAGMQSLADTTSLVAGAGDLCSGTGSGCKASSDVVIALNPNVALAFGDNAYENGSLSDYNTRYEPNWGRFKAITQPVPGNHEYQTTNATGYFDYFNGVGNQTGPAGKRGEGWYSYDLGDWHFIALNTRTGGTPSTAQLDWLDADLRANTKPCTAAYWHHPFISRGNYTGYIALKAFWDRLYASRVDLVFTGHDHNYQRWAPMDGNKNAQPDGVRQVIVGTGGGTTYAVNGTHPLLEVKGTTRGVIALTLGATGYTADFAPVAGQSWTDSFEGTCHRSQGVVPDYFLSASASISITRGGASGGKIITLRSYGEFNAPVAMSVSGLPAGVTATWTGNPSTPPADGNSGPRISLRAAGSATPGSYPVTVNGTNGPFTRSVTFTLTVR